MWRWRLAALPFSEGGRQSPGRSERHSAVVLARPQSPVRGVKQRMDLSDLIERNAQFAPAKPAVQFGGQSLTYGRLTQRIGEAARAFKSQLSLRAGDRVAILAANHPDYLALLYACARLGAMLVPLNWRLAVPELAFIVRDASVKVLVVEQAFGPAVEPLKAALPDVRIVG